jgi:hypothetical protein
MKVKIGDMVYTTEKDGPLMIILTDQDKKNIANMHTQCTKYCQYQEDKYTSDEILKWMEGD